MSSKEKQNTGTFPTYRQTSGKNRGTGEYMTQGDEYISAHIAHFMEHEAGDDKNKFQQIIFKGLEGEIKKRAENKYNSAIKKLEKARGTGDKATKPVTTKAIMASIKKFENEKEKNIMNETNAFSKKLNNTEGNGQKVYKLLKENLMVKPIVLYKAKKEDSDEEQEVTYTPSRPLKGLSNTLKQNMNDPLMFKYIISAINCCSIWVDPSVYKNTPITHPYTVRPRSKQSQDKVDERGFQLRSNPIARHIGGKRIYGGFLRAEKIKNAYHGFEASHIQYKTTKAPPLFTFIPNIVWLPKIIRILSDEPENKKDRESLEKFSNLIKGISLRKYSRIQSKNRPIIENIKQICLKQLNFGNPKLPKELKIFRISRVKLDSKKLKANIEKIEQTLRLITEGFDAATNYEDISISKYLASLKKKMKGIKTDALAWLNLYVNSLNISDINTIFTNTGFKSEKEIETFVNKLCDREGKETGMNKIMQTDKENLIALMFKTCKEEDKFFKSREEFKNDLLKTYDKFEEEFFIDKDYIKDEGAYMVAFIEFREDRSSCLPLDF